MAPRKINQQAALLKAEVSYATDPTPAALNWLKLMNITFNPMEGEEVPRDFVLPYLGHQGVDLAGLYATLEFDIQMSGSGTAGTAPKYGALLAACGCADVVTVGTDVVYSPAADTSDSCSIYFHDDGVKHVLLGARGQLSLTVDAKKVPTFRAKMLGLLGTVTDADNPTITNSGWTDGLIAESGVTQFSLHGYAAKLESLKVDFGNKVVARTLINAQSIEITDRKATGTVVIEAPALATKDFFAIAQARTKAALQLIHGTTAGNIVELDASKVQIGRPTLGQTDGIRNMSLPIYLTPDAGDDEWSLTVK